MRTPCVRATRPHATPPPRMNTAAIDTMQTITITGSGSELQGVGRLSDGRAVFVPGAIPGEVVDIRITADKGRFCEAAPLRIAEPSPDRVAPDCPHAGVCGGCQARHMRYEATLRLKRQRVLDALSRIGGIDAPTVLDTLGCPSPDRTRNKAEYPIGLKNGRPVIGAHARGSREVIPLRYCLLQSNISVRALQWFSDHLDGSRLARHLRFLVTRVNRAGDMMLVLSGDAPLHGEIEKLAPALRKALPEICSLWYCRLDRHFTHALDGRCLHISGDHTLSDHLFDLNFELSPQSFFQVNAAQAEALYACALASLGIAPGCRLRVLDAYCGAGTITLSAARWAEYALGIEIVAPAIENARRNAAANHLEDRARFICGDAAVEIPRLLKRGERFDAVILDPPRKGADPALLEAIADAGITDVCYISCDPATLARDVKRLASRGYRFEWAQPVDMFPWTSHVETMVRMSYNQN